MMTTRILNKTISLLVVCCFLSGVHFSQAHALKQQGDLICSGADAPLLEELTSFVLSHANSAVSSLPGEGDQGTISVEQLDVLGFIVLYHLFMFIYYGRLCLETLTPEPCGSMVTNLILALFWGILLESF